MSWVILSKQDYIIKKEIEKSTTLLKDLDVTINFGIKTGYNKAFIINKPTRDELVSLDAKNEEIIKPTIRGRNVRSYTYSFEEEYIIFTKRGIDIDMYPHVKNYLQQFYTQLKPRKPGDNNGRKPGSYKWYEIQDNVAYYAEFEKPKLVWGELSDKPKFAFDNNGMYPEATLFFMTGNNIKYLLSILNSKVVSWYFNQITTTSGMGTNRWKKYKIEQLPIPLIPQDVPKFEILVDYLIFLNDDNKPQVNPYTENEKLAPVFEDVLNMCVYELYFGDHLRDEGIEVLKIIDSENYFNDISLLIDDEERKKVIGNAYNKLQEQDNIIRNRIISSNIKSRHIIRRINSTTH